MSSNSSKKRPNDNSSNVNNTKKKPIKKSRGEIKTNKILKELFALNNSNSDLISFANNLNTERKDRHKEGKKKSKYNIKKTVDSMTKEKEATLIEFGSKFVEAITSHEEKYTKEGKLRAEYVGVNKRAHIDDSDNDE